MTRSKDEACSGLLPTTRAHRCTGFNISMRCFCTRCSRWNTWFVRDFQSFFAPGHEYLTRTRHPRREYVILFAGKAFYLTYMLVLPVLVMKEPVLLVAMAFLLVHLVVGISVVLVFQTTHVIEDTYFPPASQ